MTVYIPPWEETAGHVSGKACLWRKFYFMWCFWSPEMSSDGSHKQAHMTPMTHNICTCAVFASLRSLCMLRYFVLVFLRNKVQNGQKKIQGTVLLLNWKAHAKIQALLKKQKSPEKVTYVKVLHKAVQL